MTTTFENAKVGDRVYSLLHGKFLEIVRIDDKYILPIVLQDGSTQRHCALNGEAENSKALGQIYFWDKPTIIAPSKPKPKREAPPIDTLVEVFYGTSKWQKRYSAGSFDRNGWLDCWRNGATSKTASDIYGLGENCVYSFAEWRIAEDNES